MKKWFAMVLALVMICITMAVAEEGQLAPMYATLGEALEASESIPAEGGIDGEYYAVVTEVGGAFYRHVADYDEKLKELGEAIDAVDFEEENFTEKLEAAFAAQAEYIRTMPIAYSEKFTAEPMEQAELDALTGKTLEELLADGFEEQASGTELDDNENIIIIYMLQKGLFNYSFTMDTDFEGYMKAQEEGAEGSLAVKSVKFGGIASQTFDKRFHTDGTVEEPQDYLGEAMDEFGGFLTALSDAAEKLKNGEEVDFEELANTLKEQVPDMADEIDSLIQLLQQFGPEALSMLSQQAE